LNVLVVLADTTQLGKLFHVFTTLLEQEGSAVTGNHRAMQGIQKACTLSLGNAVNRKNTNY